ncbi:5587_t:CDS:2, partial [Funneliformis geosporum]
KEGILEFERTGLRYLQETSSAVQEKQILIYTSYECSTSKSATQTKKEESSLTKMVLREKKSVSYTEPETDSDSYEEKKLKKPKRVGNTHLKSTESPHPALTPSLEEEEVSIDEDVSDDESKKLAEVGKGIVRYNVIFLPESNKNDLLRITFSEEW